MTFESTINNILGSIWVDKFGFFRGFDRMRGGIEIEGKIALCQHKKIKSLHYNFESNYK